MKSFIRKKVLACVLASTMVVGGVAFPSTVSAANSVLLENTFTSSLDGWNAFKAGGGAYTLSQSNQQLALNITNVGTLNYSVQAYYDSVKIMKGGVYRVSYDISSTVDRAVEVMLQENGDDYTAYSWKKVNLTSQMQSVSYTFTMEDETDIMTRFCMNCGTQGTDLPEHTIYLDNVKIELIDDSNVDYEADAAYEEDILVNQVGYTTDRAKTAVFRNITSESTFNVVNASTGQVVYTGSVTGQKYYSKGEETLWYGDFSDVTADGTYYIQCGSLDDSYTFTISDNVYSNLTTDAVRMLYLQRCGTAVSDSTFSHQACHNTMATIYGTNQTIDVSGGWHDAGDYGRYVVPGAKAVADLLIAYGKNPDIYGDNTNIPESGNGVADILDEARYELEWMQKMQRSDGGVYHKVTCQDFPAYVMPENETAQLIVTPVSTTATADFCAVMAMAYQYYKNVDASFANQCLEASKKAWSYLSANPNFSFTDPEDITTGSYEDTSDKDERYWAACQLYAATGDATYKSAVESTTLYSGLDWMNVGTYGSLALVLNYSNNVDTTSSIYSNAKSDILSDAKTDLSTISSNGYNAVTKTYNWGSNMGIGCQGTLLAIAYDLTGDSSYLDAANEQVDYLLGVNGVGECFVTGYGTKSPQNPHHRPSMAKGTAMTGMLVGGVNSSLEDSAAKAYCADSAASKCYVDNSESYSTNEITIYWNSPLISLLAYTTADAEETNPTNPITTTVTTTTTEPSTQTSTVVGDVNQDGQVSVLDVVTLQKYLIKKANFTSAQYKVGDVDGNSKVNGMDLSKLRQLILNNNSGSSSSSNSNDLDSSATMIADFRKGSSSYFIASDGWSNGSCFDCWWTKNNTNLSNGCLELTIDKGMNGYNYTGAEYRTNDFYSYGYYETSMKAIKNNGVVSSFFTYTGPSDNNPWDEIDIEILGKDTTKVQFNYYTNGVGNHEYMYDLGFDASQGYHTYGFDWQQNSITWYIDGVAVYTATSNIPSTPGKIMMNVWPGTGVDDWLNAYDGKTPLTASYEWVTYKAN